MRSYELRCSKRVLGMSVVLIAAGAAAAQTYTATSLTSASSSDYFANLDGINNKGQVLGDTVCPSECSGPDRFPGVWTNGVITPLPIPAGYVYEAALNTYFINDSGTVVGTVQEATSTGTHIVMWTNATPAVVPDAPPPIGCSGTPSSSSYGINTAGHILGYTAYSTGLPGPCSFFWVYDGGNFRTLPFPVPAICENPNARIPYSTGAILGVVFSSPAFNDADQVVQTVDNLACGPPYLSPGFATANPALIQPSGSYSFLTLGSLSGASAVQIDNLGDVHGSVSGMSEVVIWDQNGVHNLGSGGYAYLNNVGQVIYLGPGSLGSSASLGRSCWESGCVVMWQNGVSTVPELPSGLYEPDDTPVTGLLNDVGQFTLGDGLTNYLLTPSGACAANVTSVVEVTRGGFRYNHSSSLFEQEVIVTNSSGSSIAGPISLALDNVPSNASLFGIAGDTLCNQPQGSPYINIATGPLAAGASVTGVVEYIDTALTGITYNVRVLAGPGER